MVRILAMISLAAFAASDAAAQTSYESRLTRKPAAQNSEMQMIRLQNTVSQRQRILQTSKNTLDSTRCKNCAQNIR